MRSNAADYLGRFAEVQNTMLSARVFQEKIRVRFQDMQFRANENAQLAKENVRLLLEKCFDGMVRGVVKGLFNGVCHVLRVSTGTRVMVVAGSRQHGSWWRRLPIISRRYH